MKEKLKEKRQAQIINSALAIALEKGFENSRMDDIVDHSKLSKGTIYYYYKSKKDLYLSLVDFWFIEYSTGILSTLDKKESASDQLIALFTYFIYQYKKSPSTFELMIEFWRMSRLDNDFNYKLQKIYTQFLDYIAEIILTGIDNEEFKDVDPKITALSILINIEGIKWFSIFENSNVEAHEYMETITKFILKGLKKNST
ncbi:TetR/AcrR family transcriptional regulator [Candidatus Marinimicrobia bacterium]|jgi:AcrR family transcriptional regulator|nr:TetR/AcrR family transcriptional regulator [Candidatus Neomarinimicrobiota bacterium]MDC0383516.1 TetR/AcrR family transcriptional regulator [Candidatus Neomarinimicrobiota bacterium]